MRRSALTHIPSHLDYSIDFVRRPTPRLLPSSALLPDFPLVHQAHMSHQVKQEANVLEL
ncbi:hypothetical protein KIN20_012848 [Parelaphostrongylus tenuis]|uniref:Uncharacterized protein n=1 Tax=Parelaphostrongylus tenuis TaxID=148309 RepID=A0AAD5QQP9_PARTN|nr:hypothetical protein KIN20_012848 [Parelaphostrongylus tenuis]